MIRKIQMIKCIELTEEWELVPDPIETDGVVHDRSEDDRRKQTRWELREDLGPEVSTYAVHVVVGLTKEHRSLIWENENDVLNCVEAHSHRNEEQCTVSVLDAGQVLANVHEQHNAEERGQNGDDELDVTGLWQPHDVDEVTLGQKRELVAPGAVGPRHSVLLLFGDWPGLVVAGRVGVVAQS
jgi:hypothetical protein